MKAITESIYFKEGFWLLPVSAGTDDTLTSQDKLLFAQIISLSRKNGFCFASNSYLSKLNNVTKRTITNSISNLNKNGYIRIELSKNEFNNTKRKIYLTDKVVWKNISIGSENNCYQGSEDNFYHNNIKNKKKNNIYANKKEIVPWWLDKEIESTPASAEDIAEMEELLKEFKD